MVSLALVDYFDVPWAQVDNCLYRHLIASHHGYARPFAPIRCDDDPPSMNVKQLGGPIITSAERESWTPAHRLDSGMLGRFWKLNRQFGWWGLALLESALRLADWKASATPNTGDDSIQFALTKNNSATKSNTDFISALTLDGIDGSNPLAYLCVLGIFRTSSLINPEAQLQMHWAEHKGAWRRC